MTKLVLIIGGYGNFGSFIARMLAPEASVQLIIAGRSLSKAEALLKTLEAAHNPEAAQLDISHGLNEALHRIQPDIVIHTSGPFQAQSYHVAEACIGYGCHYIDLADGREFVCGINALNTHAKEKAVLVCSGASSVPCLTGAIIDKHVGEFASLESVEYAITTAQLTNRGLATIRAVLSYAGKPFTTLIDGKMQPVYGWLGLTKRKFWKMNLRLLGNCDVPDLALFPKRYPSIKTLRFRAGLELKILHLSLTALSQLVRMRLLPSLQPLAKTMLRASYWFDWLGKDRSGFYMTLQGKDPEGKEKRIQFDLVAKKGDGLCIPAVPAILMAKKLATGEINETGAMPCLGFITLEEYLDVLTQFNIEWQTNT